ncbi:MAG: tripartite tricarboxylate transporter substrate binding protein [Alcaligenaceae bacterium]
MKTNIVRRCFFLLSIFTALTVRAQSFPSEPIKIIVPYAVGGIADVLARLVGARFEAILKLPVVVENRSGSNGTIAMQFVAQAKPDGYTLLLGNLGTQVVNRYLYQNLPFDIKRGFQPIGQIAATPMLLVVAANSPANSVADIIAAGKNASAQLNFGSGGSGSASHLGLIMLATMAKIDIAHVPYRGSSQIVPDLIGGRLTAYFDTPPTSLSLIGAGKLKPLGVASLERQPALPGVPTIAETIPGFELLSWLGLFAPAGLPLDRVNKLNETLKTVLLEPNFRKQLVDQGNEVLPSSPQEFSEFIEREAVRIGVLVQTAGIRPE